jgi:DNA-directed RNA polymerase subunit RPC12/RpoP
MEREWPTSCADCGKQFRTDSEKRLKFWNDKGAVCARCFGRRMKERKGAER